MNNGFDVEARQILINFAELTGKEQRKAYKMALKKAANILVKEAKRTLKNAVRSNINKKSAKTGKSLASGIKFSIKKDNSESKIHIMGDFRLKFFEKGTAERKLRKGKQNRGSMKSYYFFKQAQENKKDEIASTMSELISQSINKVFNKRK